MTLLRTLLSAILTTFLAGGLTLFGMGFSWGGFESLVIPFDCSSYRSATKWAPEGPTLRLHIGLEDVDDLIEDLAQALDKASPLRQAAE